MRKQYHFWPGEQGLDAWDVDRLIRLCADLPILEIALSSIREVDSVYWADQQTRPTVRWVVEHVKLIVDVDMRWPIILAHDGRVMDGMHRVAKSLLDGASTIRAVQFVTAIEPDFSNCQADDLPYD